MNKNVKLLYCLLGSAVLALLNTPVLSYAKLGVFQSGYGGSVLGELLIHITNVLSLVGFILLILFSIVLILSNIKFNTK
ncbi:hypothetical protein QWT69_12860 [Sporosarcina oncorhynchi]|uniref:Uncharacterized protein n=1 Tax=Sporosarcina oncorhynchi TaxID=3056444 RepID=A0ABZ0L4B5_9BACL|nr:hypothetical protein [Sporosarcina sp. T2O-4]WOV86758.1 hypothetical protein QWT69_12860 [Sporosarcina sp. T2O-4]